MSLKVPELHYLSQTEKQKQTKNREDIQDRQGPAFTALNTLTQFPVFQLCMLVYSLILQEADDLAIGPLLRETLVIFQVSIE